jgi:hypothetical protein
MKAAPKLTQCNRVGIDRDQVTNDILEGETALDWLLSHTAEDWTHWRVATRGWKALRLFVAERAGSADTDSYEYRSAMTSLLNTPRHSKWRNVRPSSRTAMTRLADHIDQVDDWYNGLSASDKLKWKNPETVAEHCPQHLVVKKGRNKGQG